MHPCMVSFKYPASPQWRRLCAARAVAEPHVRWFIRTGNASFWYDTWVGNCPLLAYNPMVSSDATVASFWNDTGWDRESILNILPISVAEQIFLIPIRQEGQDVIRWTLSLDGDFSFRSAWNHVRHSNPERSIFSFIWQKHLPLQVSFFIWRLVHHYLALDDSLERRGFHMVSRCICGSSSETHHHLFLQCPLSRQVWQHFFDMFGIHLYQFSTVTAMLLHWRRCSPSMNHIRILVVCYIFWHIWKARNACRFDGYAFQVNRIIHHILMDLHSLGLAFGFKPSQLRGDSSVRFICSLKTLTTRPKRVRLVSWHCPLPGTLKLNVDGCSRGNPGPAAAGGIIRDHLGRIVCAFGRFLGHRPIIYAELMAIQLGLEMAISVGFTSLVVESDSATVKSWVTSNDSCCWEYAYLLARIRNLCTSAQIQLHHVFREANMAADFMANWACNHQQDQQFFAPWDPPHALLGILFLDADGLPHIRT